MVHNSDITNFVHQNLDLANPYGMEWCACQREVKEFQNSSYFIRIGSAVRKKIDLQSLYGKSVCPLVYIDTPGTAEKAIGHREPG